MLVATLRFPLGVYHALGAGTGSAAERRRPEWPPSPVRLVGALLDAAHGQPGGANSDALVAIDAIANGGAPVIHAPRAAADPAASELAVLDGPSRWAPRNPAKAEITDGLSLRDLAGPRAAVDKGGVALGDRPLHLAWSRLDVDPKMLRTLNALAGDVAWFGTSRSPVLLSFSEAAPGEASAGQWVPLIAGAEAMPDATLRVAHAGTVAAFDVEFARRRSPKDKIVGSGLQKPASAGVPVGYVWRRPEWHDGQVHDPEHWGEIFVLEVSSESPTLPKASATYLLARAVRRALLDQFGKVGSDTEAPPLLRGRGSSPHVAIVPLPFVGSAHADGLIKGIAVMVPHPRRLEGDLNDVELVEQALARLVDDGGAGAGVVRLLSGGSSDRIAPEVVLRETVPVARPLRSLDLQRYRGPHTQWTTVTPVVHSRWQSAKSERALVDQVAADCAHVGLPAPVSIEVLPQPALRGAPPARIDSRGLPEDWRTSIEGPVQHLRLTFGVPVRGPIVLGRARHFGVGLLIPADEGSRS